MKAHGIMLITLLSLPNLCRAEVQEVTAGGFSVSHSVKTGSTVDDSWSAMVAHVDQWWNPEHTWSGSANNLYIVPKVGGCFCERLPQDGSDEGAGVEHLRIVYLKPKQEIRFEGALGPLQTMAVQGRMIWKTVAFEEGTKISFTYMVHGFPEGGFTSLAPAVDGVITEQLERLGRLLETP